ncbi:MAG TPA: hypothetical protein VK729_12380, partial [Silvibacterium sp.]|nr:hypothetical protein [Silvibacterium sp.]
MKIIAFWLSIVASAFVLAATGLGTGDEGRTPPLDGAVTWRPRPMPTPTLDRCNAKVILKTGFERSSPSRPFLPGLYSAFAWSR